MTNGRRRWTALLLGCVLTLAGAGGAYAQHSGGGDFLRRAGSSRIKGAEDAPVTVYEIADFQCPYCARFATRVMPKIDSAYIQTGKVKWVFISFPLPNHRAAWAASEAALCAGALEPGGFWALHDRLYAAQRQWSRIEDPRKLFTQYARDAGVPVEPFRACMAADRVAPLITQDLLYAAQTGVRGTPSFIIGGQKIITGVKPFEEWKRLLDEALKNAAGDT